MALKSAKFLVDDETGAAVQTASNYSAAFTIPGGLRHSQMVAEFRVTFARVDNAASSQTPSFVVTSCATSGGTYRTIASKAVTLTTTDTPQIVRVPFTPGNHDNFFKAGYEGATAADINAEGGIKYDVYFVEADA